VAAWHDKENQMSLRNLATASLALAAIVGACSPAATTSAPTAPAPTAPAATTVTPTTAPGTAAPTAAAGGATVEAKAVGSLGTVLVAGSNGLTVYTFTMDVKDSGTSACAGTCAANWPALTVAAGSAPVAGAGVTGTLATIIRADDGKLQVTYNGKPLYFFANDKAPGDAKGVYTNWEAVKP
jgi:predicted lipoprotein with Yx(FWY)xxD motif